MEKWPKQRKPISKVDDNVPTKKPKTSTVLVILAAIPGILLLALTLLGFILGTKRSLHPRVRCTTNIDGLAKAITFYAHTHDNKLPSPEGWCDALLKADVVIEKNFVSAEARKGRCHYAMNPNAEPNSPGDIVLLFETKAGWNQFGGPELLTFENHYAQGCNVAFNNTHVEFIKPKQLAKLKWKVEDAQK
jgi:hypothetical protein